MQNPKLSEQIDVILHQNNSFRNFDITYKDKKTTVESIEFLGLTLDNSLSWRKHVETTVPKLGPANFA
jgi:hypothetical protein